MLQIEYLPIGQLVADERNPKRHSLPELRRSITRFGYAEAVVVDGRTGKLVAGHGRVEALRALRDAGDPPPPNVVSQIPDGELDTDWLVPVQVGWRSKDDAEARAFLIAANRLTETGGWDNVALTGLLAELSSIDHGLDGTGYTEADLAALVAPEPAAPARPQREDNPTAGWPTVRFKIPPELRARYDILVKHWADQDDARQFERLVKAAEMVRREGLE